MKKYIFLIFIVSFNLSLASELCRTSDKSFEDLKNFSEDALNVTSKISQKILGVTVTKFGMNQGSGNVSVIVDDKGNISAVQVTFKIDGKIETMVKTFDQLSKGEKLEYINGSEKKPALVVKKASGATIYAASGGEFTFSILSEKPDKYIHYKLFLRKSGSSWIVKNSSGTKLSSVDLTPNAPWGEWNGTFSKATFE
jgi:hypothetical protein